MEAVKQVCAAPDMAVQWCNHLDATGYQRTTLRYYRQTVQPWLRWIETQGVAYDRAGAEIVDRYIVALRDLELSGITIRGKLSILRQFYKWLRRKSLVWENPFDSTPRIKCRKSIVRPLSEDEIGRLMAASQNPQSRAMWEVLYATGCRISSLLNLRPQDLDLTQRRIFFQFVKGEKELFVPLTHGVTNTLKAFLVWRKESLDARGHSSPWLWIGRENGVRPRGDTVRAWLKIDAAAAGIETRIHPHRIRHSTATHLLEHGVELRHVQEFLGHESIVTTSHYAKVAISSLAILVDKHHPRADFEAPAHPKWQRLCANQRCTQGEDGKPATFAAFFKLKLYCSEPCRHAAKDVKYNEHRKQTGWALTCRNPECRKGEGGGPATYRGASKWKLYCSTDCRCAVRDVRRSIRAAAAGAGSAS